MRKVAIIGSGGAGKSVFAAELGRRTGIPVFHLDALYWKPGWVQTPRDEWEAIQRRLVAGEAWIIDGNYGGTMDIRVAAADTVVFLDFSRWRCLWNWFKRVAFWWGRTRPDMGAGCTERLTAEMPSWILGFPRRGRPAILARLERLGKAGNTVTLRNPAEVRAFLARWSVQ